MKKIFLTLVAIIFATGIFAQTGEGWKPVRNKQNFKDSTYFVKPSNFESKVIFEGQAQFNDSIEVVALADSSAVAKINSYATGKMLEDGLATVVVKNNLLRGVQAYGSVIKALPIGLSTIGSSTCTFVDGTTIWASFCPDEDMIVTGVKYMLSTAGDFTANNHNTIGLYSVSGTTLTFVDSVASVTNGDLWKVTANTIATYNFHTTHTLTKGAIYYLGLIYNESAHATVPVIYSCTNMGNAAINSLFEASNILSGYTANSDLPATQAVGSITKYQPVILIGLY